MKISALREAAEALRQLRSANRSDARHFSQTGQFAAELEQALPMPEGEQVAALSGLVEAAREGNIALFSPDLGDHDWDAATQAEVQRARAALRALFAELGVRLAKPRSR